MSDDHAKGLGKQVKGSIKEGAGKVTGDTRTEAEGKVEKTEGKAQRAIGDVKDAIKGD